MRDQINAFRNSNNNPRVDTSGPTRTVCPHCTAFGRSVPHTKYACYFNPKNIKNITTLAKELTKEMGVTFDAGKWRWGEVENIIQKKKTCLININRFSPTQTSNIHLANQVGTSRLIAYKDSIWNNSSEWLDYIEDWTRLNQFGMFEEQENNVVLNENSVDRKPCINRESKRDELTI